MRSQWLACTVIVSLLATHAFAAEPVRPQQKTVAQIHQSLMETTVWVASPGGGGTGLLVFRLVQNQPQVFLVSAASVLESAAKSGPIAFRSRSIGVDGGYESVTVTVPAMKEGRPLWRRHEAGDVAVLRVPELPVSSRVRALDERFLLTREDLKHLGPATGQELFLLGYPLNVASSPPEQGAFGVLRSRRVASYPALGPPRPDAGDRLLLDHACLDGEGGAPVYFAETAWSEPGVSAGTRHGIVGILSGHARSDDLGVLRDGGAPAGPLPLAVVVPSYYARELLEQLTASTLKSR